MMLELLFLPEPHRADLALVVELLRVLRGDVAGHEVERVLLAAEGALGAGVGLAEVLPNGAGSSPEIALWTLSRVVGIDVHLIVEGETNGSGLPGCIVVVLLLGDALLLTTLLHMNLRNNNRDDFLSSLSKDVFLTLNLSSFLTSVLQILQSFPSSSLASWKRIRCCRSSTLL